MSKPSATLPSEAPVTKSVDLPGAADQVEGIIKP
jgi:hypothetical protein